MNLLPAPEVAISDSDVADALGNAVALIGPLLDVLWDTDPLGVKRRTCSTDGGPLDKVGGALGWALNAADVPGTRAWDELSVDDRIQWWVWRVGAVNNVAVAFPGFLGILARRLPVQDLLGFVNQAIVLCAVARELGLDDRASQVRLLAAVLCDRHLADDDLADEALSKATDGPTETAPHGIFGVGKTLWRLMGLLNAVGAEVARRPHPRAPFRYLGMLPAVGAVAGYFGELGALSRAAKEGRRWIEAHPV